ncbi:MAG: hypothetical protein M3Q31_23500 [Actinomycetota bacterium]|nr:hypothetical protein [Actinomycetota bacterium]
MPEPYAIEFWEGEHGQKAVLEWIRGELTREQRAALGKAMEHVLGTMGISVGGTQFGKQLGDGLCEFRLRYNLAELGHRFEGTVAPADAPDSPEEILLRVFFHAYGDRIVLLLHGYDKGADPSKRRQQREIAEARRRLGAFRASRRS